MNLFKSIKSAMSKKFYAINGVNYWKPNPAYKEQKLAMLDNGVLVVLTNMVREGWSVDSLPKGYTYTEIPPEKEMNQEVIMVECPTCRGTGETMEIVDHDENYNSVWANCQCDRCNGTGKIVKK